MTKAKDDGTAELNKGIARAIGRGAGMDIRRYLAAGLKEFEGPEGLARELRKLYAQPSVPAVVKARLLADFIRMWLACSVAETSPDDDRDVADLVAELKGLIAEGSVTDTEAVATSLGISLPGPDESA